jgi:hypothetical protein
MQPLLHAVLGRHRALEVADHRLRVSGRLEQAGHDHRAVGADLLRPRLQPRIVHEGAVIDGSLEVLVPLVDPPGVLGELHQLVALALVVDAVHVEQRHHMVTPERPLRALVPGQRGELHAEVGGHVLERETSLVA